MTTIFRSRLVYRHYEGMALLRDPAASAVQTIHTPLSCIESYENFHLILIQSVYFFGVFRIRYHVEYLAENKKLHYGEHRGYLVTHECN